MSTQDAVGTLATKQAELMVAQEALTKALEAVDTDEIIAQQQRVTVLTNLVSILEEPARLEREAAARVEAKSRCVAIRRALGSNGAAMADYEGKVAEAARQLRDVIERMNERAWECERLRREHEALVDRFGLDGDQVMMPTSPTERELDVIMPKLVDLTQVLINSTRAPITEEHEHMAWRRRTYSEVSGTEAGRIIQSAGLKPWPKLSEQQREEIEEREKRQAELRKRNADRLAVEAAFIPPEGSMPLSRF
jgi:hypothetical protein